MLEHRKQRLAEFVAWTAQHVKGDEKGEAQILLDHLFQAFGHRGLKEAGATLEMRIKKPDNKGTAFADLVWKPVVLIEMKKRGQDLSKHYRQAFDYWVRLVPGRPRYVVLCNFDEFWVYDFETQMDSPVDRLSLEDLPQRYGALAFLFPTPEKPVFGNDHEAVTRDAADRLATCFNKLVTRGVDRPLAQRFTLQILVALTGDRQSWRRPILEHGQPVSVPWPKADVIIGNPPFNGAKKLRPDLGPEYINAVRRVYPDVPGMADYCVLWFRKSHDHLPECTADDPIAGRAGLVGTQNIRNNQSRVGGLDYIAAGGTIVEAVDNQPWSGDPGSYAAKGIQDESHPRRTSPPQPTVPRLLAVVPTASRESDRAAAGRPRRAGRRIVRPGGR